VGRGGVEPRPPERNGFTDRRRLAVATVPFPCWKRAGESNAAEPAYEAGRVTRPLPAEWRTAEVLISNASRHPSRFERAPGSCRVDCPNWRKAESTIPTDLRLPIAFQATPRPARLAFHVGGGVRSRSPHVAALTVFKTGPAPSWLRLHDWPSRGDSNTRPRGSEPRALILLSYATSCPTERWSGQEDSNLRSRASEARALAD
jgi:hypothetical protein